MIIVPAPALDRAMRVLREVATLHPEAMQACKALYRAMAEGYARDLEFNNEVPALCRLQAD